jgi:hypothetical protein
LRPEGLDSLTNGLEPALRPKPERRGVDDAGEALGVAVNIAAVPAAGDRHQRTRERVENRLELIPVASGAP